MKKTILNGLAGGVLILLAGCQYLPAQRVTDSPHNDALISSSLTSKLANNKEFRAVSIQVETIKGVVYLRGFVRTKAQKRDAEQLARTIKGVSLVQSNLVVANKK